MKVLLRHLIIFLLSCLLITLAVLHLSTSSIFFAEDQAFMFSVAESLRQGEFPLIGPPSHIGGRHFGSLPFLISAGALQIAGGNIETSVKLLAFLNFLALALVIKLARRLVPAVWRNWVAVPILLLACSGYVIEVFRIPWYGHILFVTSSFAMYAGYLFFSQGLAKLPLFLLSATLVVHTHFSALPLAVALFFGSLTAIYLESRGRTIAVSDHFRVLFAPTNCLLLLAAVLPWLPLIYYEIFYERNALQLFTHLSATRTAAGIDDALIAAGYFFRIYIAGANGFKLLWLSAAHTIYAVLLISSLFFAAYGWRSLEQRAKSFVLLLFGILAMYIVSLARQAPPLESYYFNSLLPLPFLYAVLVLMGVAPFVSQALKYVRRKGTGAHIRPDSFSMIFVGGFCLLWILSIGSGIYYFQVTGRSGNLARYHTLLHSIEVGKILKQQTQNLPSTATIIGKGSSQIIKDAYLFQLGRRYYHQLNYHQTMKELPSFTASSTSENAFVILCPQVSKKKFRLMWQNLKRHWKKKAEVDLSSCTTCRQCRMWSLERKGKEGG